MKISEILKLKLDGKSGCPMCGEQLLIGKSYPNIEGSNSLSANCSKNCPILLVTPHVNDAVTVITLITTSYRFEITRWILYVDRRDLNPLLVEEAEKYLDSDIKDISDVWVKEVLAFS